MAAGCAGPLPAPEPGAGPGAIRLESLVIRNVSYSQVSEVTLRVPATGEFVSCANIPIHGHCRAGFPQRSYQGHEIEISWQQDGRRESTGAFEIEGADRLDPRQPASVRVLITPAGTAVTEFVQPGR